MFSKEDFIDYFEQVSEIENKMRLNLNELFDLITNESIILILKKIYEDEMKHLKILKKIKNIIESKSSKD